MLHFATSRTILPLALLAAVAMTCLQGAAFAGTPMEPTHRKTVVSIKGLDLTRPSDVDILNQRLEIAARKVCEPEDARDLRALADRADCKKMALSVAGIKRDTLIADAQSRLVRSASVSSDKPAID